VLRVYLMDADIKAVEFLSINTIKLIGGRRVG
jgi:hypothetical protein